MLATATACGASTTTASLCSFSHLQHQPLLSLSYCRKPYLVLTLLHPLGQALRYPEKSFYTSVHTRVADIKGLSVLPFSCGLILRGLGFSASAGTSKCMNQTLRKEKSD